MVLCGVRTTVQKWGLDSLRAAPKTRTRWRGSGSFSAAFDMHAVVRGPGRILWDRVADSDARWDGSVVRRDNR